MRVLGSIFISDFSVVSFPVEFLSGFGIRVIVVSQNEFGSLSSSVNVFIPFKQVEKYLKRKKDKLQT